MGYPLPAPACVSSFFLPWRRKRKKARPQSAKLLSAVLTTATAMSLRFVEDDDEEADCGGRMAGPVGDGDGDTIGGGGTATAGVRVEGKRVWMLRCCAAARGQTTAARRRRGRRGDGAIAVARGGEDGNATDGEEEAGLTCGIDILLWLVPQLLLPALPAAALLLCCGVLGWDLVVVRIDFFGFFFFFFEVDFFGFGWVGFWFTGSGRTARWLGTWVREDSTRRVAWRRCTRREEGREGAKNKPRGRRVG